MKNIEIDKLFNAAKSGDDEKMKRISDETINKLSAQQKQTLEKALSDKEFLNKLLSSDSAQQIMRKLQGGDK